MAQNYLIIGNDEYLKKKELAKIKDELLSEDERSTSFSAFPAGELDGIMSEAKTMPFLSDKKMVLVNDIDSLDKAGLDTLAAYLEGPMPSTVMVMTASSEYTWKKKNSFARIAPFAEIKKAESPKGPKLKRWIRSFFIKRDINISDGAIDLIVELKGTDSAAVKNALEKLLSYSGGEPIELKDVEKLIGRSVTETVYKLVDAIEASDRRWAFEILNDLYSEKKSAQKIIGYLAWHIRTMQRILYLLTKGADEVTIRKDLGYKPYYTRKLISSARAYRPEKIKLWNRHLMDADVAGKTGALSQEAAVELLVIRLAGI